MAKVKHESIKDAKSHIPGGAPSASTSATVKPGMKDPRRAVAPRQDPGNQAKYHRGAKRVWSKVRPRASSKCKA